MLCCVKSKAVSTAVYLHYGTPEQLRVNVEDGSFIPFTAGEYTLVYTAADSYGNVGKTEIPVTVEPENADALQVTVSQPESGRAGQTYEIAVPVFDNNRGEETIRVYILSNRLSGENLPKERMFISLR